MFRICNTFILSNNIFEVMFLSHMSLFNMSVFNKKLWECILQNVAINRLNLNYFFACMNKIYNNGLYVYTLSNALSLHIINIYKEIHADISLRFLWILNILYYKSKIRDMYFFISALMATLRGNTLKKHVFYELILKHTYFVEMFLRIEKSIQGVL